MYSLHRHLKNLNEMTLVAAVCILAVFITRLNPGFVVPFFLAVVGYIIYISYVIGFLEKKKETAILHGAAIFLGLVGGFWDDFLILLLYSIKSRLFLALGVLAVSLIIFWAWRKDRRTLNKGETEE